MEPLTRLKSRKQNIKTKQQRPLSVVLVEAQVSGHSKLKKALVDFNYDVTKHLGFEHELVEQLELCRPDILILVTDKPSPALLRDLGEINQLLPLPIIVFAENDSPNVIENAIKSGVSAYVVDEILPRRLKSIISVAHERFKQSQLIVNELKQAKTQLQSRKLIEIAKGLLMQQKAISEPEAYKILRKMAMDQGTSIRVGSRIFDV